MEGVYEGISLDVLVFWLFWKQIILAPQGLAALGPAGCLCTNRKQSYGGERVPALPPAPTPDPQAGRWLSPLQQHHRLLSLLLPSWADTYPPPPIGLL